MADKIRLIGRLIRYLYVGGLWLCWLREWELYVCRLGER